MTNNGIGTGTRLDRLWLAISRWSRRPQRTPISHPVSATSLPELIAHGAGSTAPACAIQSTTVRWSCGTVARLHFGAILLVTCWMTPVGGAKDWPTASLNPQRNAFSSEQIDATRLEVAWEHHSSRPPSPAWHGPAKWDAYNDVRMHSMRNYDEVFQPICVAEDVYIGSSVEDSVICLDAASGQEKWSFCTEGPIRIAPTFSDGKLHFGSDDGYAYCIRADDGQFVWKFRPRDAQRLVLNNGRFIPLLPIRSGVTVDEGIAYFAAAVEEIVSVRSRCRDRRPERDPLLPPRIR